MCTVTYIPTGSGFYLTSNRDEHYDRPSAQLPEKTQFQEEGIWYPKDGGAGGSWIAMKQDGTAAVLLNGAFEKHSRQGPYRQSRGLTFMSIVKQKNLLNGFAIENLEGIEPFTLILKTEFGLFECIWDGKQKYQQEKQQSASQIWSSCTLYHSDIRLKRETYFDHWLKINTSINAAEILELHQSKPFPDTAQNFMMQRSDGISTVSITCIKVDSNQGEISYFDNNLLQTQDFCFGLKQLEQ